jgi:Ser/Thr protein kinase RdoA (MazF antagonist)
MKPYNELTRRGKLRRLRQLSNEALKQYDLQVARLRFFTIETNTMFRIDTPDGRRFVLRIYSDEETTLKDNQVEMYWLRALVRDTDLHVSEPLPNRDGKYITPTSVQGVPGVRRCALFRWVPGRPLEAFLSPEKYYKLGQTMARLHDHAGMLSPPPNLQPKRWDKVFYYPDEPVVYNTPAYRHLFPPERVKLIDETIQRADELFASLYADESNRIWIHGDLHFWNVHYYKGALYVIDFEDVMLGYPLQDVAVTLYYGRNRDDYLDLRNAFVQGYTSLRCWPVNAPGQLETLMAARSVNFINYVARIDPEPDEYIESRCRDLQDYLHEQSG